MARTGAHDCLFPREPAHLPFFLCRYPGFSLRPGEYLFGSGRRPGSVQQQLPLGGVLGGRRGTVETDARLSPHGSVIQDSVKIRGFGPAFGACGHGIGQKF